MTSAAKKILDEALSLPEDDRRRLAEVLLDSVPRESSEEVEGAWRGEVVRRIEEVRRGDVKPEPWSEVKKHIREALESVVSELRFHPAARVELVEAILYHEAARPEYGAKLEAEVDELVAGSWSFPRAVPRYPRTRPSSMLGPFAFRASATRCSLPTWMVNGWSTP